MKRKMVTTLMAVTMCTTMLGSTVLAAGSNELGEADLATGSTITGDSGVENPTYKIVVPTTLDFAVDPFEQKGQSQIYSKDFYMVNKSNVPVQLDCAVTLEADTGVEIKDTEADVTETNTDKLIYMEAEIPGAVTETNADPAAYTPALVTDGTDVYETGKAPSTATTDVEDMVDTTDAKGTYSSSKKIGLGTTEKKLSFALEKATYKDYYTADDKSSSAKLYQEVAGSQAGSAAFRFSGKVNTKATWSQSAVTATVKYTFNGLTGTNYAALVEEPDATAHAYVEVNKNVVESDGTTDIVIYYTGTQPTSVTLTPINITGATKTPMTKQNGNEIAIDSEKVTIKASFIDALIKASARGKGTYKVTIGTEETTVTFK